MQRVHSTCDLRIESISSIGANPLCALHFLQISAKLLLGESPTKKSSNLSIKPRSPGYKLRKHALMNSSLVINRCLPLLSSAVLVVTWPGANTVPAGTLGPMTGPGPCGTGAGLLAGVVPGICGRICGIWGWGWGCCTGILGCGTGEGWGPTWCVGAILGPWPDLSRS